MRMTTPEMLEELKRQLAMLQADVKTLLVAEARRTGREEARDKTDDRDHAEKWDERAQVWLRHFLPASVIGLFINGLLWWWTRGNN